MFGKDMNNQEWIDYMNEHYIKNNERRDDILKDLNITEYYFYKRNRELGIKRNNVIVEHNNNNNNKKKLFEFNYLSGKFRKGKIDLK